MAEVKSIFVILYFNFNLTYLVLWIIDLINFKLNLILDQIVEYKNINIIFILFYYIINNINIKNYFKQIQ